MSSSQNNQPTFLTVAPRFVVQDLEQALAFYGQLGFQTTYHDEHFAIVERDGLDLHLNYYPFRNLILFAERTPEADASSERGD
jgi:catechol 2,3-dioxygenase-like lactoylglutathione lyase family enzyme